METTEPTGATRVSPRVVGAWVRSPVLRLGLLAVLLVAALVLALSVDDPSLPAVRRSIAELGPAGPLVFVGLYVVVTILLLPATPFTVLAGVLFGPAVGSLAAIAGATLGAIGSFLVGRLIGRRAVEQLAGERVRAVDRFLAERGFVTLFSMRLIPLFPFNVLNLVSGVTSLRLRDFVLATALGIVPATVLLAAAGGSIDDPGSPLFIGAVVGFALLALVGGIAARRWRDPSAGS